MNKFVFYIMILLFFLTIMCQESKQKSASIQGKDNTLNLETGQDVINYLSKRCKSDYNQKYYSKKNGVLRYFDCSTTPLCDEDIKYLSFFPNIKGVHVTGEKITDGVLKFFAGMIKIKSLALYRTSVSGVGFKYIKSLTTLEIIRVKDSPFTDEGCKYLSEIKFDQPVNELDLSNTNITDEGLKYIGRMNLDGGLFLRNTNITDKGIRYLKNIGAYEVRLEGTKVTRKGYQWLKKNLKNY